MSDTVRLSGHVICYNNAATIARCLASLAFCDELVVVDSGSTDGTWEIVKARATTAVQQPFAGFGAQRQRAWELSRGEWLFWLDADEAATPELAREVREVVTRNAPTPAAFEVPIRCHYPRRWRSAGYYWHVPIRLFRKAAAHWDAAQRVHEALDFRGPRGRLKGAIEHWSWEMLGEALTKSLRYAEAGAGLLHSAGRRRSGACTATTHALARFLKHYLRDGGWRHGSAGFFISAALALEPFVKYARLWELAREAAGRPAAPPANPAPPGESPSTGSRA